MKKFYWAIVFFALVFISLNSQNAFAVLVEDEASCLALLAFTTWSGNTCTLTTGAMLVSTLPDGSLRIDSSVIFEIASAGILQVDTDDGVVNFGTLDNKGTILSGNFIWNFGTLENSGTITNDGTIINSGNIENSNDIENRVNGIILNRATIDNLGKIDNDGLFRNSFDTPDIGVLENSGLFINSGTITNAFISTINIQGVIQNLNSIVNFGTINILCGGELQENQPDPPGTINLISCFPDDQVPVGGELFPVDTSALLLAGAQTTFSWLIPVMVSAVGISLVFLKRK